MARWGQIYDKKALLVDLAIWFGSMAVCYVTNGAAVGIFLIPMLMSMTNSRQDQMLVFLTILCGFPMSNHTLVPKSMAFNAETKLMWVFLAVYLTTKVFGRRQSPLATAFLGITVYAFYMIVPSIFGWNAPISLLKLFLFIMTFFAYYEIANVVILGPRAPVVRVRSAFLAFACYLLIGSVLLIPIPGISQMRYEQIQQTLQSGGSVTSLFCGMMYHSQALGPVVAIMFVMVLADYLYSVRRKDWLYFALLASAPILIYKTSSRTAMGSMIAGALFVLWNFMRTRQVGSGWKAKVMSAGMLIGIVGSIGIVAVPQGREAVARYVLKKADATNLKGVTAEDVLLSRQGLMDTAMYNFRQSPVVGNGFQIMEMYKGMKILDYRQLLTAPIEKGVWVTAVLEEGGVIGMALFLTFLFTCIPKLVKRKAYTGAAVIFTYVISNLGEFSMFSMSGVGGYAWAMCFMGIILDAQRLREEKIIYWAITPDVGEDYDEAVRRFYGRHRKS